MNALKTGIHAKSLVLPSEKLADLEHLIDDYYSLHHPATPEARGFLDDVIHCEWLLRRYRPRRNPNVAHTSPKRLPRRTRSTPSEIPPPATPPPSPNSSTASIPPAAPTTAPSRPSNCSRPTHPRQPTLPKPLTPNPFTPNWLRSVNPVRLPKPPRPDSRNFASNPTLLYFWFMTLANVARHHHHIHAILRRALS